MSDVSNSRAVSIVIPAYNAQSSLTLCLESIFASSFDDFEVIVIDDDSSDDTFTLAQNLASHEPRIRVLRQEHRGVSAARNYGIDQAHGTYICFIDADDMVVPHYLERLYSHANTYNLDWLACGYYRATPLPEGFFMRPAPSVFENDGIWYGDEAKETACKAVFLGPTGENNLASSQIGIYKTATLHIHGIRFSPELSYGEDTLFNFEVAHIVNGFGYLVERLYYYVRHASSFSHIYNTDEEVSLHNKLMAALAAYRTRFGEAPSEEEALYNTRRLETIQNKLRNADGMGTARFFNTDIDSR